MQRLLGPLALLTICLWSASTYALGIEDCAGMERIACMWKLTCAKEPNNPNKIIPADCAQNYKEPQAPPPPPVAETAPEPPPKKTPIEQLYYFDLSELENQKLLPDDASGEDIDEETEDRLIGKKSKRKKKDSESSKKEEPELSAEEKEILAKRKMFQDMLKRSQGWQEVE